MSRAREVEVTLIKICAMFLKLVIKVHGVSSQIYTNSDDIELKPGVVKCPSNWECSKL